MSAAAAHNPPPSEAPAAPRQSARLEDRYATALYELALQSGTVEGVADELSALQSAIAGAPDFARMLQNPVLGRAAQAKAMAAVAGKLGAGTLVRNFLRLLAQKGRQTHLTQVIGAYHAIAAAARGELTATVRAAAPLTEAQQQQLSQQLGARHNATVKLEIIIDPNLLGGFSARVGTKLYDRTLDSQLNRLMLTLKEAA